MKKIFLFSLAVLFISLGFKWIQNQKSPPEISEKFESYSQTNSQLNETAKIKKTRKTELKLTNQIKQASQNNQSKQKKKLPPRTSSLVLDQGIHTAQTDTQGNIFPRSVTIDKDKIIAYGDLIIGDTAYLDDYQSGEKELKMPPPETWPNGSIPYIFDSSLDDYNQKEIIERVTQFLNESASLHFHPRKSDEDHYVVFKRGEQHCYANVGFRLGETIVSLSPRCGEKEIYHELLHVLGLFHEQNRPDRDDYIQVLWENIDEENWAQFEKFSVSSYPFNLQDLNEFPFEFETIMLYDSKAFSNTTDYSMVTNDGTPFPNKLTRPTPTDLARIKALYPPEN